MSELLKLEPTSVFYYFDKICAIPHASYHTREISNYLVAFAIEKGLHYVQDKADNVVIFKPGTAGYEDSAPVILQGHIDMVAEKTRESSIDMLKEGLRPYVEDGFVKAKNTTLGGDDGIAVACMLAILAADDIPHPPIEAVFTSDEEVGMLGAAALDCSILKGRLMLNMDNELEGNFLVSCAGGISVTCHTPLHRMTDMMVRYQLSIHGLTGGHSGAEIHKYRASANVLAGRLLNALDHQAEFYIAAMEGGSKDNAIPTAHDMTLYVNPADCDAFEDCVRASEAEFKHEYASTDPELAITYKRGPEEISNMLTEDSTKLITFLLMQYPNGVQRMSQEIEGLVESSLNLGILKLTGNTLSCTFSVRSSVTSAKEALVDKLVSITEFTGGYCDFEGDYPAWEYKKDSPLRELALKTYKEMYPDHHCEAEAIHAGIECGIFSDKLPGLDCISYGPDLFDIHTTRERMSIESVAHIWDFTLRMLALLK